MDNFNVMQIIPSLESGGVEQGTIDLANFIADKKLGSYVVSSGGKMLTLLDNNVKHFQLPVNSKNFISMPLIARKLNKLIIQNNINIVHVRSRAPAWILQFINKKKFISVSTFHNVYGAQNLFKAGYNKSLSKVDHITAISKYVKSEIEKTYNIDSKNIKVINRGIDTDFLNPDNYNNDKFINFLTEYNISSDKKIILYPGRLTYWKGQIEFLKVIELLNDVNLKFYFVGDDKNKSYTSKLLKEIKKKKLENKCKIVGNLSKENLKFMYRCSEIVISAPIQPEGFGRTISESLAMKKIILCYNYGGAKDQIINLDDIYKVNPKNIEEMKNKIIEALRLSREDKVKITSKAREYVVKNFSKEKMVNDYLKYYKNILK